MTDGRGESASSGPPRTLRPSDLDEVNAAVTDLDLGRLRWAVRSLPLQDALGATGTVIAATDFQLKADLGRYGEAVADRGWLGPDLLRRVDPLAVSMLLAPHGGPRALIASSLAEDPGLPTDLLVTAAAALMAPDLRADAVRRALEDLDADVDFDLELLVRLLPEASAREVENILLTARPSTSLGRTRHMALMAARLDQTAWIPDLGSFIELVEAWAAALRGSGPDAAMPDLTTAILLRGMARTWGEQGLWRASGFASLALLFLEPDAAALGPAVFEANTIGDWPMLEQAVDLAVWTEESITPEDARDFIRFVMPAVGNLLAHRDRGRAETVVGLAERCAATASGPLPQDAREILEGIRTTLSGAPGVEGLRDLRSQGAVFWALWGFSPFAADGFADDEPRVPAAQVLRIAHDRGSVRRQGPLCQLLLADLAIEFGDLAGARETVDAMRRTYPRDSSVLVCQRKLAAHAEDRRRCDEFLDELARLWESEGDHSGVDAQMRVLEELADTRSERLVRMRARRLLHDPRFALHRARLGELAG